MVVRNYDLLGGEVDPDPSTLRLEELRRSHPEAFHSGVEELLTSVLREGRVPFSSLSDFQVYAVCCLLNNIDLLCVMPTGAGKGAGIFLYTLCIRKRNPKGLVVVGQPLSTMYCQLQMKINVIAPPCKKHCTTYDSEGT